MEQNPETRRSGGPNGGQITNLPLEFLHSEPGQFDGTRDFSRRAQALAFVGQITNLPHKGPFHAGSGVRRGLRCVAPIVAILGIGCLLAANDEIPQRIQATRTEHADLPAGGTVRLKNSTGELFIEGWDQPGVEVATIKSTKLLYPAAGAERVQAAHMLDEVKVTVSREGGELVIATDFPRHRRFLPRPSVGARDFDLEYRIKVPRSAKLIVDHDAGEIHFDFVTGDIHATMNQGAITLLLPPAGQYSIDAKSRIGAVTSDIPGTTTRKHLGHAFVQESPAPHNLYLRTGFGDIIILRAWKPAPMPPG